MLNQVQPRSHPDPAAIPVPQGRPGRPGTPYPLPPATGTPPRATRAPRGCLRPPAPAAVPEVSPGPARPDACKVQENQSESWCGQPRQRATGARASCPCARPRAAFRSLLPQLSIASPSAPAASWTLPPAGWRLPRRCRGSAPPVRVRVRVRSGPRARSVLAGTLPAPSPPRLLDPVQGAPAPWRTLPTRALSVLAGLLGIDR